MRILPYRCAALAVGLALPPALQAQSTDLLRLAESTVGASLPADWRQRAVRGARAPSSRVVDSAGVRFLRVEGTAAAGWLVRAVDSPIAARSGQLGWRWRVNAAPARADLRSADTDDSPLRVFVAFGPLRAIGRPPRTIFYSLGGAEPEGYARKGHGSEDVYVIRSGAARAPQGWRDVRVDPFADYRRAWGGDPPPIAVVGLLQDTDQTRGRAAADIASLTWTPTDATGLLAASARGHTSLFAAGTSDGIGRDHAHAGHADLAHRANGDWNVHAHRLPRDGQRFGHRGGARGATGVIARLLDW